MRHLPYFDLLFASPWLVFAIVWAIGTASAKPVARSEGSKSYLSHNVFLVIGTLLLMPWRFAPHRTPTLVADVVAIVLAWLGIGFTIWARLTLAGNWSANVTIKEGHELTTTGPYRWVRHPIYTGLLLALVGTAIGFSTWSALLSIPFFVIGLVLKLRIEERFLREQFGPAYDAYAVRSKALIPFLW